MSSVLTPALLLTLGLSFACGDSGTGGAGAAGAGGSGGADIFCGDAIADPDLGEECDDGNFEDTDDCLANCTLPKCGDLVVHSGFEDCDDGNSDNSDGCVGECVVASCGDGFVQAGVEDCDDGNTEDGDACTSTCTAGVGCGNNIVDGGEECDDGNTDNNDDCVEGCFSAFCGDGYAQAGVEECDDGNSVDDDPCSNGCFVNVPDTFGCPGVAVSVPLGGDVTLGGNTADATPQYEGSCGGADAPEYVYALTPEADGVLTLDLLAVNNNDLDPVLYVRDACENGAELACVDATFAGGLESATFAVQAGTTYYVFADGYNDVPGEFLLGATLLGGVAGDNCPGVNIPLSGFNDPYTVSGNTAVASADHQGTGNCDSDTTPEVVYRIVPPENGKLVAALDPSFDASLYVRTNCSSAATELACSEMGNTGELELINVPVTAGNQYFVFVDGFLGESGPYTVEFTLLPP